MAETVNQETNGTAAETQGKRAAHLYAGGNERDHSGPADEGAQQIRRL